MKDNGNNVDRGPLLTIVVAMVWIPLQITLSLIFATGGMFFLLIFGVVLGPFIGLFFLIRHLLRDGSTQTKEPPDKRDERRAESGARQR